MKSILSLALLLSITACSPAHSPSGPAQIRKDIAAGEIETAIIRAKALVQSELSSGNSVAALMARHLLAQAYFTQGQYDEAARHFMRVHGEHGGMSELDLAWEQAITSHLIIKDIDGAMTLANDDRAGLSGNERDLLRALLSLTEQDANILAIAETIEAIDCQSCKPLYQAVQFDTLSSFVALPRARWQEGVALLSKYASDTPYIQFLLGVQYKKRSQYSKAQKVLDAYINQRPEDLRAVLALAMTELMLGNEARAAMLTNSLLARTADAPLVLQLSGVLAFKRGEFEEAARISGRSINLGLNSLLNLIVAGLANAKLDNLELAINYLERVKRQLPTSHPMITVIDAIVSGAKAPDSEISDDVLLRALSDAGESTSALAIVESELLESLPREAQDIVFAKSERFVAIRNALETGNIIDARRVLDNWLEVEGETVDWLNAAALFAAGEGNDEQANAYLAKAKMLDANNIPSLLLDIRNAERAKDWEGVIIITSMMLRDRAIALPSVIIAWVEAHIRLSSLRLEEVGALTALMGDQFEGIFIGHLLAINDVNTLGVYLYDIVGEANWQAGHWRAAILLNTSVNRFEEVSRLTQEFTKSGKLTQSVDVQLCLEVSERINDTAAVSGLLQFAEANSLKVSNIEYYRAGILLLQKNWHDAKEILLSSGLSGPAYLHRLARAYYHLGETNSARQALTNSLLQKPTLLKLKLLFELERAESTPDVDAFKRIVLSTIEAIPFSDDIRISISQWVLMVDPAFTVILLDHPSVQRRLQSSPVLLNNLAWAQLQINEFAQAKQNIERAIELAPDNASLLNTQRLIDEKLVSTE